MGIGFLVLLIIYAVLILVSIIILIISIKNKSIIWILFSTIFLLFLVSFLFINKLDEVRICNDDVKNDLKFLKIDLKDNFYIIDNKIEGMAERYQYTKLKISEKDRNRLINEIKNSDNFKTLVTDKQIAENSEIEGRYDDKDILNFKYPEFFSRERYIEIDNIPTRIFLSIEEQNNILSYQKIED